MHPTPNGIKKIAFTVVRAAIGWHFMYEGLSKLVISDWSAGNYLANATGFLAGFYHWLASSDAMLSVVDFMNIYGLIFIGLALFTGLFTRISAISGIFLLLLYYFAYPPFGTSLFGSPEGHVFVVNRNLIEVVVLSLLLFGKEAGYGIDSLFRKSVKSKIGTGDEEVSSNERQEEGAVVNTRREVLKNLATLPFLGALGWGAVRQTHNDVDVLSGATVQLNFSSLNELKGVLPKGKIKDQELSRLILGGNLVGGWAHSRDLHYVPSLFRAYNTEKKIYETLMLAEQAGINSINIGFPTNALMARYRKATGSKIKVISQVAPDMENGDIYKEINQAIDYGADILQVQGNWCDWLVRDNRIDVIEKMLDRIRSQGFVAGLGSHTVDALIACEAQGIIPDYYMKTMHHDNYWSAHPRENRVPFEVDGDRSLDHNKFHDNIFCLYPDRTTAFVNRASVPVMGFKVLAAGSIYPADGFNWAFENGADFICVGMFDFQIVDDVNTTIDVLNNLKGRQRAWFG